MLVERFEAVVKDGMEAEFNTALGERVAPLLLGVEGVKSVQFGQGVENPMKFILLVGWGSMDMHVAFKDMPSFRDLMQIIGPYIASAAAEHFELA